MDRRRFGAQMCALAGVGLLASCGGTSQLLDGKRVTLVVVNKRRRMVHLLHNEQTLRTYPMELGFTPEGHKQFEGDGKTPEGMYVINRRNPQSRYHLSIGISYPNRRDYEFARSQGRSPGGEIFIHGTPREVRGKPDWTAGCVAVSNRHMDEIFRVVPNGTPILITP